ncbi:MAG: cysteine desulfurase NifS [Oliverpabstia sp.]|nr:cysteine desulfurase NifS [Oliverpabstia sp.]
MKKMIYMDNAATTKTAPEVVEAMLPYFSEYYGNPSSVYELAGVSKKAINEAREKISQVIGAKPNEIYFTAGGSEADNWAIKETYEAYKGKGNHIITTKVEHHAVLHTCQWLEKQGAKVTYLDVDENGIIRLEDLEKAITPETILISVMAANNEIGSLMPVKEIGMIAKEHGILFHTDAVQAFGQIPLDVEECHIDMLSSSAHKINGPKGIGCLYIRKGLKLRSFIHGGAQERKRRAGTENVPGIVGYGKAAELAMTTMEERTAREREIRDYMIEKIKKEVPYCKLNGHPVLRLPNNVNFSFQFIEGESLLIMLDMEGICASSGSACTSGSLDPSHVLLAIGLPHEIAHGSLRLTIGEETTKEDVDFVVGKIKGIVERLRNMSPLYEDFVRQQKNK